MWLNLTEKLSSPDLKHKCLLTVTVHGEVNNCIAPELQMWNAGQGPSKTCLGVNLTYLSLIVPDFRMPLPQQKPAV